MIPVSADTIFPNTVALRPDIENHIISYINSIIQLDWKPAWNGAFYTNTDHLKVNPLLSSFNSQDDESSRWHERCHHVAVNLLDSLLAASCGVLSAIVIMLSCVYSSPCGLRFSFLFTYYLLGFTYWFLT